MCTGVGATKAGLTCSSIKVDGGWAIDAGALVLADGGICCIDEFGCMNLEVQNAIHEAMEQQTISVAKASCTCTLNCKCVVMAAMNPPTKVIEKKRHFGVDEPARQSVADTLGIASSLVSRFDVILLILDRRDAKWDDMIAKHVIKGLKEEERYLFLIFCFVVFFFLVL